YHYLPSRAVSPRPSFTHPTGEVHPVPRISLSLACLLLGALPLRAEAPSFVNDVVPIFTRFGCNQGACHGKGVGQNGFRLSLRGYAPEMDHPWLTREYAGRRISRVDPEASLIL